MTCSYEWRELLDEGRLVDTPIGHGWTRAYLNIPGGFSSRDEALAQFKELRESYGHKCPRRLVLLEIWEA